MGMSLGGKSGQRAEINITPMIDVLLVLIIIFMVIAPTKPRGLNALVPQPPSSEVRAPAVQDHAIVISVHNDRTYQLNQEPLDLAALRSRLADLFKNGANEVIFLRGDKGLEFGSIAEIIDLARGVGVYRVALMTN